MDSGRLLHKLNTVREMKDLAEKAVDDFENRPAEGLEDDPVDGPVDDPVALWLIPLGGGSIPIIPGAAREPLETAGQVAAIAARSGTALEAG